MKKIKTPTSSIITKFRRLVDISRGNFDWAKKLNDLEIKFIYDIATTNRDYVMSEGQCKWAGVILRKIKDGK